VLVVPELLAGGGVHAYTWLNAVVRYMTPSTTIGAVSIDSTTSVWNTNAGRSLATFCAVMRAPG
jgi:hypothetical protein